MRYTLWIFLLKNQINSFCTIPNGLPSGVFLLTPRLPFLIWKPMKVSLFLVLTSTRPTRCPSLLRPTHSYTKMRTFCSFSGFLSVYWALSISFHPEGISMDKRNYISITIYYFKILSIALYLIEKKYSSYCLNHIYIHFLFF